MIVRLIVASLIVGASLVPQAVGGDFKAGAAGRDITPPPGLPLWGYAARHDARATGTHDPLTARAVVIEADGVKLAIVGVDLGRAPTPTMMTTIREGIAPIGIKDVLIVASHTHHGPVLELVDRPGMGRGAFDAAIAYGKRLPEMLIEVIREADRDRRPARIGVATRAVDLNRNRHAKREPKPIDPGLTVVRIDDESGRPIAALVNFAAHPTTTDSKRLTYSADYPGALRSKVEADLKAPCLFLQGAAGDLTTKAPPGVSGTVGYGEVVADRAIEVWKSITPTRPAEPSIKASRRTTRFKTRIDLGNPFVIAAYGRAFFPELIACMAEEFGKGVDAESNAIVVNGTIAIVAGSGEFFCDHANRLRERSRFAHTLFLGYCNGHHMYFPTIEAAFEGGYGAEPGTSLAELGAGELLMDRGLIDLYTLQGRFAAER